jgi:muramoyltetrapeptide carboxypeptidase
MKRKPHYPQCHESEQISHSGLIHPQRLRFGDTVGVVSPASWMSEEELAAGKRTLEKLGFSVHLHPQNYLRFHQFAGRDEERIRAFEAMLLDSSIKAIMFAKGGYGALRIIDQLDFRMIRANPKIIIGFSDATALLASILEKAGLITFHGPMLLNFTRDIEHETWHFFERLLIAGEEIALRFGVESGIKVLRPGIGEGELFGGNLTLLSNLVGTASDFVAAGRILFVEDYDERLYRIDRMFLHLKRSGKLSDLAALVIGAMTKIEDEAIPFGFSLEEIAAYYCQGTAFPIVSNFPFGHIEKQMTIPLGSSGRVVAEESGEVYFNITEPAVC